MITFDEQVDFFRIIGKELKLRVVCYVIGGSAMMFYGAKVNTKDVDLVFLEESELESVKKALYNMGFDEKQSVVKIFRRYEKARNTPVMMIGRENRFDLFLREIITMKMSENIVERAKQVHEFDNFIVKVIAPEYIFLLKSATEREKDRADALSLIQRFKLDWKIIVEESMHQTKLGQHLFPVYLFDFLYELKEDLKAEIPAQVLKDVRKMAKGLLEEKLSFRKRNLQERKNKREENQGKKKEKKIREKKKGKVH